MTIIPLQYGRYYHIYNRGNNGETIFRQQRNYSYFLQRYARHISPVAETFAYCLLPNHFHFAIRTFTIEEQLARKQARAPAKIAPSSPIEPSRAFNNFFIAYAKAFNKVTGRTGTLLERPFGRKIVDSQRYLLTLIQYIHLNPHKHGLVTKFQDWPWSSYHLLLSAEPTYLSRDTVLSWYDGRDSFIEAHQRHMDDSEASQYFDDDWFD